MPYLAGCKVDGRKAFVFLCEFDTRMDEQILMRSGISFTSLKNAEENLRAEMKTWKFEKDIGQSADSCGMMLWLR